MVAIAIHATAERISAELLEKLKAGTLKKVGIEEIRAAIRERFKGAKVTADEMEQLEERTTRRVVERAAFF